MIMWLETIASAYRRLCNKILIKKPTAEAPVNINNFLCFPFVLLLAVKNNRAAPNKEKIIKGDKKRRGP